MIRKFIPALIACTVLFGANLACVIPGITATKAAPTQLPSVTPPQPTLAPPITIPTLAPLPAFTQAPVATATLVPTALTNLDPAAQAEIFALIQENMDAANDKDLERYMATIHPQSSFYASTRTALAQFFKMDLEIKYDVPSLEVTSITDTEARVNFVLKTVKISGSQEFRNNQVTGVWILRKDQGKWKIYGQEVTNIEYLK